jgi:checkpoint serine/threonine-protein kinase
MLSCMKNGLNAVRRGTGESFMALRGASSLQLNIHSVSREKAHEVFKMGIHRKAQPLKRLQTSYQAFQTRAADSSGVITTATPSAVAPPSAQRRVLGDRSSTARGLSSQSTGLDSGLPDNGARLDVFTEGSDARRRLDEKDGEWADFGTREQNRRENVKEASTWKGEVLPQSAKAVARIAPRTPKMEVFRDTVSDKRARACSENSL